MYTQPEFEDRDEYEARVNAEYNAIPEAERDSLRTVVTTETDTRMYSETTLRELITIEYRMEQAAKNNPIDWDSPEMQQALADLDNHPF